MRDVSNGPRRFIAAAVAATILSFAGSANGLATPPEPVAAAPAGAAILMGVAVAAASQTQVQQAADRSALSKRLHWLIDRRMKNDPAVSSDAMPRIVRLVFDVDENGLATNVRVGKRSGNKIRDRIAMNMITKFDRLPGGARQRVCAILQYGRLGQESFDRAHVKAMKDEEASAIADLRAGRDGPQYDARGHIIG